MRRPPVPEADERVPKAVKSKRPRAPGSPAHASPTRPPRGGVEWTRVRDPLRGRASGLRPCACRPRAARSRRRPAPPVPHRGQPGERSKVQSVPTASASANASGPPPQWSGAGRAGRAGSRPKNRARRPRRARASVEGVAPRGGAGTAPFPVDSERIASLFMGEAHPVRLETSPPSPPSPRAAGERPPPAPGSTRRLPAHPSARGGRPGRSPGVGTAARAAAVQPAPRRRGHAPAAGLETGSSSRDVRAPDRKSFEFHDHAL